MKRISFLLIFLLYNAIVLIGQTESSANDTIVRPVKKEVKRYIPFSTGISALSARDFANSPLLYAGSGVYTSTGWIGLRKKSISVLNISFAGAIMHTRNEDDNRNYNARGNLSYTYLYRCLYDWTTDTRIFVGGTFRSVGNFRINPSIVNTNFTYDWFTSLAATGRYQKRFIFNTDPSPFKIDCIHKPKEMRFEFQLSIPFVSHGIRPNYIALPDVVDSEYNNITFDNTGIHSFNNFYRLNTNTSFSYVMTNENIVVLSYLWDFYSYYKDYNNVKASMKAVTISFLFNIR